MRNLILVTASALALTFAGIAVAHDGFGSKSIKSASATFTATTANDLKTVTCTGSDGNSYAATRGTYSGTAVDAADPTLNGTLTFNATSFINTTTNYGTVSGRIQIGSGDSETDTQFNGVYANGTVVGLAQGHNHGGPTQLLANVSAGFSATGGFTTGLIGGGTSAGSAVESVPGQCAVAPTPKPDKVEAIGSVSAVSSTSITVAGITCVVGSSQSGLVANVHTGDRVDIVCDVANGVNTLDKLSTDNDHGHFAPVHAPIHLDVKSQGHDGHFKFSLKKR
jgi:hypothetical protein